MKKIALLFFFLPLLSFSQNNSACREIINQSNEKYHLHEYPTALVLFQKAVRDKCSLSEIDYYNGACIASLAKQEKPAFTYLHISVEKGWEKIQHMDEDEDLDNIRNKPEYKKVIAAINARFSKIALLLGKLEPGNFENAVPYTVNGKWGWLNRQTNIPFTKPLFEYTDFKCARGLFFRYRSNKYLWTNERIVRLYEDFIRQDNIIRGVVRYSEEDQTDSLLAGFRTDGQRVTSFSNKFNHVYLVREIDSDEMIGVARDKQDRYGIIRKDGNVFKNFDFRFANIDYFRGPFGKTFFVVKEMNNGKCLIYDRNGTVVPTEPFTRYGVFSSPQWSPLNDYVFVGEGYLPYLQLYKGEKINVLDEVSFQTIFKKDYDKVNMINGPTSDMDRTGNGSRRGIEEPFFLVSEGNTMFYIDNKGKEYRVK